MFGHYQHNSKILINLQLSVNLEEICIGRRVNGGQNALLKDLFVQGCLQVLVMMLQVGNKSDSRGQIVVTELQFSRGSKKLQVRSIQKKRNNEKGKNEWLRSFGLSDLLSI